MKPIYKANATSTGGRDGKSASDDGRLEVSLSVPEELGGDNGPGTNPEQLFAAGYSACYIGALKYVAGQQKIKIPADLRVSATIGIGENPKGVGFAISADLVVSMPGIDLDIAQKLIDDAHQVCPYSNATRGNIDVTTTLA